MPAAPVFASPLADGIAQFIAHKRVLGRRYETEAYALRLFDRYLVERRVGTIGAITPELIAAFLTSRPRPRPRSYNHLLGVLHRLFDWLVAREIVARSPVRSPTRRAGAARIPCIVAPAQARRLLELATRLPDAPGAALRGPTFHAVFAVLYGLGLRVSEACQLTIGDVDRRRRLLIVRDTKFGKDRLVPFGPRMGAMLDRYLARRRQHDPALALADDTPLFAIRPAVGSPVSGSAACSASSCLPWTSRWRRGRRCRASTICAAPLPCTRCCAGTGRGSIPARASCTSRRSSGTCNRNPPPSISR